jgi:rubredoxin
MENLIYVCRICSYIYNPALGDPDGGIMPGTAFADIPEDWVCPICKKPKSFFKAEEPKNYSYKSIEDVNMDDLLLK